MSNTINILENRILTKLISKIRIYVATPFLVVHAQEKMFYHCQKETLPNPIFPSRRGPQNAP
jgi:hypothetical protein